MTKERRKVAKHIVLLRGINVAGKNLVAMADLRGA